MTSKSYSKCKSHIRNTFEGKLAFQQIMVRRNVNDDSFSQRNFQSRDIFGPVVTVVNFPVLLNDIGKTTDNYSSRV